MATKSSNKLFHIAVMRLSAMGDVAMTVPVLQAVLQQYPEVRITVISRPFFKPFFDHLPNINFFEFDEKVKHKGFIGLLRLYKELRRLNIDAFADLHNVLRSKVISSLFAITGTKTATVDKGRDGKKALTRSENKIFKQLPTMFERHAEVFDSLGFKIDLSNPFFPAKPNLDQEVLSTINTSNKKLIGIAPFAQYDSKVYPIDLMQKVVDELATNDSVSILLFGGGKKEKEILDTISDPYPNVYSMAGKIKFRQELDLIANLNVMVSMDSGNGHLAAMYGVKVISIWGATHPFAGFMPFNQSIDQSITPDRAQYPLLPTSVYGNKIVDGYQDVMRSIDPKSIVNLINRYV